MNTAGSEEEHEAEADRLIGRHEDQLRASFAKSQTEMVANIEVMEGAIKLSNERGFPSNAVIWNAALFVNMAHLDLSMAIEHAAFEPPSWRRQMHVRHLGVLIYEISEDLPTVLGKQLRDELKSIGLLEDFAEDLNSVVKPINRFRVAEQAALKNLRSAAGAHRDHQCAVFLDAVRSARAVPMCQLGMKLGNAILATGPVMQKIINRAAFMESKKLADGQ